MTTAADARREQARGNGVGQAGQFGHQTHSEPGAFDNTWWGQEEELAEAVASVSLDVSVRRFGLPSNRHRKEQWYETPGVLSVEIPVVAAEDAPPVLTVTPKASRPRDEEVTYLLHDGELFSSTGRNPETALRHHSDVREPYRYAADDDETPQVNEDKIAEIQEEAANDWIVIDGIVHKRRTEPVLQVKSWGVELESGYRSGVDERGFITDSGVYTLDQWEQAQQAFEASRSTYDDGSRSEDIGVALRAGDGLEEFRSGYRRPPALDYEAWPAYDRWEERNEVFPRELAKMRSGIAVVDGAVSRVDDGLGGTRAVIDWSLFSEQQEKDYKRLVEYSNEQ